MRSIVHSSSQSCIESLLLLVYLRIFVIIIMQDFQAIEEKWKKRWEEDKVYATDQPSFGKKKAYILDMFPYPSGAGLHVGHSSQYIGTDIYSRYMRMTGHAVLHPMGWDSFGLPAENYAIKTGTHPRVSTMQNVENFKRLFGMHGLDYDWDREINTTDPEYYKWTQWIFLQMFKKDLAYEAQMPINWCPNDKTGLANEEVVNGECERCGHKVEQKTLRQWVLKITEYAERLLEDLDELDWPESLKEMQRNWIGKSIGTTFSFDALLAGETQIDGSIDVFTTRIDTVFGVTYVAIAPEHELLDQLTTADMDAQVKEYVRISGLKTQLERTELQKEKTGVFTGSYARNPFNGELVPIYVCDYVLGFYGTGAVMAVPAHDERDWEFARQYDLPIKEVLTDDEGESHTAEGAFTSPGRLVASGDFTGLTTEEAKLKMTEWLEEQGYGEKTVNYKLRDWVFSRQRYWGEPIPLIHCDSCGVVPVPEDQLPLTLPEVEKYEPTGTGESPLAAIDDWVHTECPSCAGDAKRETNTMPQWAGSCWYYLRYLDPKNDKALADPEILKEWLPVDTYVGGVEHAVLHLLYARFWHKFLFDIGAVPNKEPFQKLVNQGLIQAEGGGKMSKSKGNVINADETIQEVGADVLRLHLSFLGPYEDNKPWSTKAMQGVKRFVGKVWSLAEKLEDREPTKEELHALHTAIGKVGPDYKTFNFNTAVSHLMVCANSFSEGETLSKAVFLDYLKILAPMAVFMAEELWEQLGQKGSIHLAEWPEYQPELAVKDEVTYAVQVNGKVRGTFTAGKDISKDEALDLARDTEGVAKYLEEGVKKEIFVPGKLVSFVV